MMPPLSELVNQLVTVKDASGRKEWCMEAIARESVRQQAAETALQQAAEAALRQAALAQEAAEEAAARAALTIQMTMMPIRLKLVPQPVTAQDACGMGGWPTEALVKEPVSVSRRVRMKKDSPAWMTARSLGLGTRSSRLEARQSARKLIANG